MIKLTRHALAASLGVVVVIAGCVAPSGGGGSTTTTTASTTSTNPSTTVPDTSDYTTGLIPSDVSVGGGATTTTTTGVSIPLPPSVDLHHDSTGQDLTVPAGNQNPIGSCSTWATGYSLMGWYANHQHWPGTHLFAPMYLYSQIHGVNPNAPAKKKGIVDLNNLNLDTGSYTADALEVLKTQGVDTQDQYGQGIYDYTDQPDRGQRQAAASTKITGYEAVVDSGMGSADKETALKTALAQGKPVVVGFFAKEGFFKVTSANPVDSDNVTKAARDGNHAVLAVGYDSTGIQIENSWGQSWGTNGFGTLSWAVVDTDLFEGFTIDGIIAGSPAPGPAPAATLTAVPPKTETVPTPGPGPKSLYRVDASGSVTGQYYSDVDNTWSGWFPLTTNAHVPGSMITAVPDGTGEVDLFAPVVGSDGKTYIDRGRHIPGAPSTDLLGRPIQSNRWSGWGVIANDMAFPSHPNITGNSARPGEVTLYVQGTDGRIWSQYRLAGQTAWSGWFPLGTKVFPAGTKVAAVSASTGSTSLFTVDAVGQLWTNYFYFGQTNWTDWQPAGPSLLPSIPFLPARLTALAGSPGETDVFAVSSDGRVWSNTRPAAQPSWTGWTGLGSNVFPTGSTVSAVTTAYGTIGLYIVGFDHQVWDQFHTDAGGWSGWFGLGNGNFPTGQPVNAFTNGPGNTDLHVIGTEGNIWGNLYRSSWSGWLGYAP